MNNNNVKEFKITEEHFDEMKKYLLLHMGSTFVLPPEEAFEAMEDVDLSKEYDKAFNEFKYCFWSEQILPKMKREHLSNFFNTMKHDLGDDFFDKLVHHMEKEHPLKK